MILNYTNLEILKIQLSDKTKDELFDILISLDDKNRNPLMIASERHPDALKIILEALNKLSDNAKKGIFMQVDKDGKSPLLLAIYNHPKILPSLLKVINALDDDAKTNILTQMDKEGRTPLMFAAQYKPEAVPALLEVIKTLKDDVKQRIFTQGRLNALMLAAKYEPEAVPALLKVIKTLKDDAKQRIFTQVTQDGLNALMLAAQYKPKAVPALLKFIKTLNDDTSKKRIISQFVNKEYPLRKVVRHPETLTTLREVINTLKDDDVKDEIITKVIAGVSDALVDVERYTPSSLPNLLDVVNTFSSKSKQRILNKYNFDASALTILARGKEHIFQSILKMDEAQRYIILKDIHDNNPDSIYAQIFHTKRRLFKPSIKRGILGLAEKEYQRIREKYEAKPLPQNTSMPVMQSKNKDTTPQNENLHSIDEQGVNKLIDAAPAIPYLLSVNLLCIDVQGFNKLMFAARYEPEDVPALLEVIKTLKDDDAKQRIFTQIMQDGWNALMLAVYHHPENVPALLEVIKTLKNDAKQRIFTQVTHDGWNALMKAAASHHPENVPALLEVINTFEAAIKNQILMQKRKYDGISALMLVSIQIELILNSILKMDEAQRFAILKDIHDNNQESIYAQIFHSDTCLDALEQVKNEYQRMKEQYDVAAPTARSEEDVLLKINSSSYTHLSEVLGGQQSSEALGQLSDSSPPRNPIRPQLLAFYLMQTRVFTITYLKDLQSLALGFLMSP